MSDEFKRAKKSLTGEVRLKVTNNHQRRRVIGGAARLNTTTILPLAESCCSVHIEARERVLHIDNHKSIK
jgi:hypothetical protein